MCRLEPMVDQQLKALDLFQINNRGLGSVIHVATRAAVARAAGRLPTLFRNLGDQTLRGEKQACDRRRVLERGVGHLLRIHAARVRRNWVR